MPLESLSQPFNPDEPGRKIREVQVENEPEHELSALEKYNHVKQFFYLEGNWNEWYEVEASPKLPAGSYGSSLLSMVEQELGIPSSQDQEHQKYLDAIEENTTEHPLLTIHVYPKDPEKARLLWWERSEKMYEYEGKGYYFRRNEDPNESYLGAWENLLVIFNESLFDAEGARLKLHALERYLGMNDPSNDTWYDSDPDLPNVRLEFLTILIESSFDMLQAIRRYERLKNTDAFDGTVSLWRQSLAARQGFCIEEQLFEILFQIRLEKYQTPSHNLTSKHSIPEERNF